MDVGIAILNGELNEDVYMVQPKGFKEDAAKYLVCRLKRSICGLKQTSHQWYLKFDNVISFLALWKTILIDVYISRSIGANISFSFFM